MLLDEQGNLQGFRVNRVEANKIYPAEMPRVRPHARLYRNFDKAFEDVLSRPSAVRKIRVEWTLGEYAEGFTLEVRDEDEVSVAVAFPIPKRRHAVRRLKTSRYSCPSWEIHRSRRAE